MCSGATAYTDAYFGSGSGPYHLDDVQCTGSEVSILSCSHSGIGIHNCRPGNEAGVKCVGKFYIPWKQLMVDIRNPSTPLTSVRLSSATLNNIVILLLSSGD